jgi:hypothetical protein
MSLSRPARLVLVCLTAATLALPVWGASPRERIAPGVDLLTRLWSVLTAAWADAGCWIDPNGGCATGSPEGPGTDEGCGIDPHGGCAAGRSEAPMAPPGTDAGCGIDPNGGCGSGS